MLQYLICARSIQQNEYQYGLVTKVYGSYMLLTDLDLDLEICVRNYSTEFRKT